MLEVRDPVGEFCRTRQEWQSTVRKWSSSQVLVVIAKHRPESIRCWTWQHHSLGYSCRVRHLPRVHLNSNHILQYAYLHNGHIVCISYALERSSRTAICISGSLTKFHLWIELQGGGKKESSHKNGLLSNKLALIGRRRQIELIGSAAGASRRCDSGAWLRAQTGAGQIDREVQEHDVSQKGRHHLKAVRDCGENTRTA